VHGGPTGSADQVLSWLEQFFASRGRGWYVFSSNLEFQVAQHFQTIRALLAVGVITCEISFTTTSPTSRDIFSERLAGNWGILDLSDCVLAVQQLSKTHIDGQRVFIRGGSAGGFTMLAAICINPDVFADAASTESQT
jgi:dipeptidyl aminopeptidase/acylaminoacyl peptidase